MRHEQRLIYNLWQLRQAMPRVLDQELEPLGITMPQFGTLNAIAVAGAQSAADLARRADVRPQTMAPMLAALVDTGLLERRPHPVHRRVVMLGLTTQGREVWRRAGARVAKVEQRLRTALGDDGYEAMHGHVQSLVEELGGSLAHQPPVWPWPRSQ